MATTISRNLVGIFQPETSNELGLRCLTQVILSETYDNDRYRLLVLDSHRSHITTELMLVHGKLQQYASSHAQQKFC